MKRFITIGASLVALAVAAAMPARAETAASGSSVRDSVLVPSPALTQTLQLHQFDSTALVAAVPLRAVSTVSDGTLVHSVRTARAVGEDSAEARNPSSNAIARAFHPPSFSRTQSPGGLLMIVPFLLIGAVRTAVSADKDSYPVRDTIRQYYNLLLADIYYFARNHSGTVAPACARGTTATKVKTTNNTTFIAGGVPTAKAATDDFWTLTGGVLAVSKFRKYRLLVDTAGAATVQASTDAATAAACDFATRPADGVTIVGVLTVATDGVTTFTPGTTNLNAAGITSTFIDGSDSLEFLAAPVVP